MPVFKRDRWCYFTRAFRESARSCTVCFIQLQDLSDCNRYLDHENLSIHFVSSILSRPSRLTFNDLVVTTIEAAYEGKDEKRLVMYSYNYTSFVDEFAKKGFPPKKEMTVVGRTGSSTVRESFNLQN